VSVGNYWLPEFEYPENFGMLRTFTIKCTALLGGMTLALTASATWPRQQVTASHGVSQATAYPQELVLSFDPAQTVIHWTLPATLHTVHGTFRLKQGEIRWDPDYGKASGEIIVDATSGQSGNSGRDFKMHREVLESAKFSEIVFRPDRAIGTVSTHGPFSVQVHGVFSLRGADHEITVPVQAEFDGNRWKATASFLVPYVKWGLKNPSTFFLKVKQEVQINIEAAGQMHAREAERQPSRSFATFGK
jgi:polyisoprenoid-binding protein YceI